MDNTEIKEKYFLNIQGYFIVFSMLIVVLLNFLTNIYLYSSIGIGISLYLVLRMLIIIDFTIPVIEIMLLMAASQWVIGPIIDYNTQVDHYKYYMYVDEKKYMSIVVPLFFVFTVSSLLFGTGKILNQNLIKDRLANNMRLPIYLVLIGLFFWFTLRFMPPALRFFCFLASNLSLVGIGLLYFTNNRYKWIWTSVVLIPPLITSINSGMFHNLILWSIFIFVFINIAFQIKFSFKLIIILSSISIIISLQAIKKNFRDQIYNSSFNGNKIELFFNLLTSNLTEEEKLEDQTSVNEVNTRLNQGWIISKIIDRIPRKVDYLGGETVYKAIKVSLVPRFLMPNKIGGGGKETYRLLTGMRLNKKTAMGVSLVGEFYGNFGFTLSLLIFFIWGRLLNLIVKLFTSLQYKYSIIFFLLPIVFLQVIKAETDLTTVLNHITKSLIFVYILMVGLSKGLKLKL
jgi:hypothetical protein